MSGAAIGQHLKLFGLRSEHWIESSRNDPVARALADRHYSRKKPGSPDFVGPALCLILVGDKRLWVSTRPRVEYRGDHLDGIICAIFRNEGNGNGPRSSDLVREAVLLSWEKFGQQVVYTYIDPRHVQSANPGYCYKVVGFRFVRRSKENGLHLLELRPEWLS